MTDTGKAKLPGLQAVSTGNAALDRWIQAATERMEVREGSRGNPAEAVVTQRDLDKITKTFNSLRVIKARAPGDVEVEVGDGLTGYIPSAAFEKAIRESALYKHLMQSLDDPTRFDDLPAAVRDVFLQDIAALSNRVGADITRVEKKLMTSVRSLSTVVEEVTASVAGASAGVRSLEFASAETNRVQAGQITQVAVSLGNYYQDGTPGRVNIEQTMLATAATSGLSALYSIKLKAGAASAGFGMYAADTTSGAESVVIFDADKFAVVTSRAALNPAGLDLSSKIPFGIDGTGIYLNGNVYLKGTMQIEGLSTVASLAADATNALANAATANAALVNIASDSILSPSEKPAVKQDYDVIIAEQSGIDTQATNYSITTEKTTYDTAVTELTTYLGTLTGWNTIPGVDVAIVGTTFRTKFSDVYTARQAVLNKIAAKAKTLADTAQAAADAAQSSANTANTGLTTKLNSDAKNVLTGSGGLAVGSLTWNASGVRTGGYGLGFTSYGLVAYNSAGALTFAINGTTGDATFYGALSAATGTFAGTLTADAVNAVATINIAGNAVTVPASGSSGVDSWPSCSLYMPYAGAVYVTANIWLYETEASDGGTLQCAAYAAISCSAGGAGGYCISHAGRARHLAIATAARFDVPAGTTTFTMYGGTADVGTFQTQGGTIMALGTMK